MSDLFETLDDFSFKHTIRSLSPLKQRIALALVDGDNFNQIGKREGLKTSKIYKIKEEMQSDLLWLKNSYRYSKVLTFEDEIFSLMIPQVSKMKLSRFAELYLEGYSDYSYEDIKRWESGEKHWDKAIVAIALIVRELFVRAKPIVIDYYFQDRTRLVTLIQKFKVVVKSSPIISSRLSVLHTDADLGIRLIDGSQVRAVWTKGRQPVATGTISIFEGGKNISCNKENIPRISYLG